MDGHARCLLEQVGIRQRYERGGDAPLQIEHTGPVVRRVEILPFVPPRVAPRPGMNEKMSLETLGDFQDRAQLARGLQREKRVDRKQRAEQAEVPNRPLELLGRDAGIGHGQNRKAGEPVRMRRGELGQPFVERTRQLEAFLQRKRGVAEKSRQGNDLPLHAGFVERLETRGERDESRHERLPRAAFLADQGVRAIFRNNAGRMRARAQGVGELRGNPVSVPVDDRGHRWGMLRVRLRRPIPAGRQG